MAETFRQGELFVCTNGDRWELGQVKRPREDGKYACWYHTGDTASVTDPKDMHKLANAGFSHVEREGSTAERKVVGDTTKHCICGACEHSVDPWDGYCRDCGRRLVGNYRSWEEVHGKA